MACWESSGPGANSPNSRLTAFLPGSPGMHSVTTHRFGRCTCPTSAAPAALRHLKSLCRSSWLKSGRVGGSLPASSAASFCCCSKAAHWHADLLLLCGHPRTWLSEIGPGSHVQGELLGLPLCEPSQASFLLWPLGSGALAPQLCKGQRSHL